jgi:MoaA/NifB/PqqE/SkfB family radical SAM enzyme
LERIQMNKQALLQARASFASSLLTKGSFTKLLDIPILAPTLLRLFYRRSERHQRPLIASINVVNRCNLHCAGCYWTRTEREEDRQELSIADGEQLIQNLWKKGARQFLFIGGEPMTEREKVEQWVRKVARLGGISTVITNGTYGLPEPNEWPRTHYFVSCDGDRTGMDRVRGFDVVHKTNVFEQVKSVAYQRKDVMLAMTINKLNVDRIEAFVREVATWDIGGVVFSFATPNVGDRQSFYLSVDQREKATQELLRLKHEFKDFVAMGTRAIELLRPSEVEKWSPRCPTFAAQSIRADGQPLERCVFGPTGDCSRCGCNISTSFVALREGDRETARFVTFPARMAGIS